MLVISVDLIQRSLSIGCKDMKWKRYSVGRTSSGCIFEFSLNSLPNQVRHEAEQLSGRPCSLTIY